MWTSFRVLLTEKCNANCKNCFNKSSRALCDMNINDFKQICQDLS